MPDTLTASIAKIEKTRNSRVLVFFTSDRPNINYQIDEDIIEVFFKKLTEIGQVENIDLVLYSRGGQTHVPLALVKLIRKFCNKFSVLLPFRANSAATMISMGADEIYMTKMAELGPIDPQITFTKNGMTTTYAAVDIFAYLEFVKEKFPLNEKNDQNNLAVLNNLHQFASLTPTEIAQIYRVYRQSFEYANELSSMKYTDKTISEKMCNELMNGYGSHVHKIDSIEAKELGFNIINYDKNIEDNLVEIYDTISVRMALRVQFMLTAANPNEIVMGAVIVSKTSFMAKLIEYSGSLNLQTNQVYINSCIYKQWEEHNEYFV